MRILFFGDIHGSKTHLNRILEKSREADVLVCIGDLTVFEHDLEMILRQLNSTGKPLLTVHGNHESSSSMAAASVGLKNTHFIHKTHHIIDDVIFFGYGGGGFAIMDNKFDIVADLFIKDLKNLEKKNNKSYKIILITHAPPHHTALDYLGENVGCKNFRKFIEHNQPVIAVSGHIHETFGFQDKILNTLLINPGPDGRIISI